jgi:hypothetical protein
MIKETIKPDMPVLNVHIEDGPKNKWPQNCRDRESHMFILPTYLYLNSVSCFGSEIRIMKRRTKVGEIKVTWFGVKYLLVEYDII